MYLVVTNKRDLTSDFIVLEFQRRGLPYVRLNTEDFAQCSFVCDPLAGTWQINVDDSIVDVARVRAAYFRRPGIPEPISQIQDAVYRNYCTGEWLATLQSLYWTVGDRWLNAPHLIAVAENKIRQLSVAKSLGFLVPETIFANDPAAILTLSKRKSLIGKPLKTALVTGADERVIFTSRMAIDEGSFDAIKACPVIFQEEVKKTFDIRATVVGNKVFSASIDSQKHTETEVDWRRNSRTDLEHRSYKLPDSLNNLCVEMTRSLGLKFGAIDFILDEDGRHWFLEINPNGQWGWIETRTGQPISAAIVDELERIARE